MIGIVQDTLAGMRLMTKRDTFIEKDLFMNMLARFLLPISLYDQFDRTG